MLGEELAAGQGSQGSSEWGCVWLMSSHQCCPQGSILGLLNIFIKAMDAGVECILGAVLGPTIEEGCEGPSMPVEEGRRAGKRAARPLL